MLKKKRSENALVNLCYSCSLFKKYYQYNLWFGSYVEYNNIKYCKKYTHKYVYYWVHFFLLQRFNLSFVILLYKSPCFIKFVESGFLKYLDYHFLLLFYNNCFVCDLKDKQKIKFFVKFYFQIFLKKRFEKDLLITITKAINEIVSEVFLKHLTNRVNTIQISVDQMCLINTLAFKVIKINYYKTYFTNFDNSSKLDFFFLVLKFVYKSLLNPLSFKSNKILKLYLRPAKVSKFTIEKSFIDLKTLYCLNKNIQYLTESIENLSELKGQKIYISLYKNSNVLFKNFLIKKCIIHKKPFKNFFKSFNIRFVKHNYK